MAEHHGQLTVLFENESFIAIDKPAGVLSIPAQNTSPAAALVSRVTERLGSKAWVVHRLDRDTTGVIIFAKTAEAHSALSQQFEHGIVRKVYQALVSGVPEEREGEVNHPISVNDRTVELNRHGKEARTRYRVMEAFRAFSFVELYPETGRRHQIRLHMLAIGHPLAVDADYGDRTRLMLSDFKRNYKPGRHDERPILDRLSLHAASITVQDPATGSPVTISSPLPRDIDLALKQLRKYNSL